MEYEENRKKRGARRNSSLSSCSDNEQKVSQTKKTKKREAAKKPTVAKPTSAETTKSSSEEPTAMRERPLIKKTVTPNVTKVPHTDAQYQNMNQNQPLRMFHLLL